MNKSIVFLSFLVSVFLFSCATNNDQSDVLILQPNLSENYNYASLELPPGVFPATSFNEFIIDPETGELIFDDSSFVEVTNEGAKLGRVLFYDKNLSISNTVSCGSCHLQELAFTDGKRFSEGFEGNITHRNTMAFANPISQNNMFWDSRSSSIVDLSLKPVQNHIEMGMENLDYLTEKLNKISYYPSLFQEAYGSGITEENISRAIAEFVGSITTANSRADQGIFNEVEEIGRQIFFSETAMCSQCHGGSNFAAQDGPNDPYGGGGGEFGFGGEDLKGTTNIGLDIAYADNGRVDGNFKIPSLRNIALTGPYMHDGRFNTLEEVIEHYNSGIKPHEDLDHKFLDESGNPIRMDLSNAEKTALVAFLHTLTDEQMLTDPKYSNPFE